MVTEINVDPKLSTSVTDQSNELPIEKKISTIEKIRKSLSLVDDEIGEERESWGNKFSYILALVGYAIGLGNIWRFPYLLQENGGAIFLVPYTISIIFLGVPVFYLELAIGQRLRKGPLGVWQQVSPKLGGMGILTGVTCFLFTCFYSCLVAWVISYIIDSCRSQLLFSKCELAVDSDLSGQAKTEELRYCENAGPSQYYWNRRVLDISSSISEPGNFNWWMAVCVTLSWICTYAILVKGIDIISKVVYFTAIFPFVVLFMFLVRGLLLENMENGFKELFTPKWEALLDPKIWKAGASQTFFSLGIGYGCLISFASYLKPNNNCQYDAILIPGISYVTSILATFTIFPYLGYYGTKVYEECKLERRYTLLKNLGFSSSDNVEFSENGVVTTYMKDGMSYLLGSIPNVSSNNDFSIFDVRNCTLRGSMENSASGTGLVFIVFAEAVSTLGWAQLWSFLFFFMLFTLGIDSCFGTLEGAIASVCDFSPTTKKWIVTSILCAFNYVLAMALFVWGWGQYILTWMDDYVANWPLLISGFLECFAVGWVYGLRRFSRDLTIMTGKRPSIFWLVCWKYISPILILFIIVFNFIDLLQDGVPYRVWDNVKSRLVTVQYPVVAIVCGFLVTGASILWVPLVAILRLFNINIIKHIAPSDFPEAELIEERDFKEGDELPTESATKLLMWGEQHGLRSSSSSSIPKVEQPKDDQAQESS